MTALDRIRWAVLGYLGDALLWAAVALAPSPFARVWLSRGLALAAAGMREEIARGAPVIELEVAFDAHGEQIPTEQEV